MAAALPFPIDYKCRNKIATRPPHPGKAPELGIAAGCVLAAGMLAERIFEDGKWVAKPATLTGADASKLFVTTPDNSICSTVGVTYGGTDDCSCGPKGDPCFVCIEKGTRFLGIVTPGITINEGDALDSDGAGFLVAGPGNFIALETVTADTQVDGVDAACVVEVEVCR